MKLKTKFEDEDFRLGEVCEASITTERDGFIKVEAPCNDGGWHEFYYKSLKEVLDKWEDVPEEPKEYWHIFGTNVTKTQEGLDELYDKRNKEIGNYFETKEDAEKAVRKLKAWRRLKDKGFRFEGVKEDYTRFSHNQIPYRTGRRYLQFNKAEDEDWLKENWDDIKLLFFGDEE